ncbi:MAG: hypothetical protein QF685_00160 [Verrucomicrobiota bacterium]|jgi:hypothetical protein|nr:hypothetical protein [Verrucomicrobiota bacterium]
MRIGWLVLALLFFVLGCNSSGDGGIATVGVSTVGLIALGAEIKKDNGGDVIEINLTGQPVGNSDLAQIAQHTKLQKLWLSRTGVTDIGLIELQSMKRLRVLGLARTGITDAGLKYLAAIKSLREVYVFPTKVTDGAVDELKAALPGVRVIY